MKKPQVTRKRKSDPGFSVYQRVALIGGIILISVFGLNRIGVIGDTTWNLSIFSQSTLNNGLMLYWTFDGADYDGTQASAEVRDRSGNNRHGDAFFPAASVAGVASTTILTATSRTQWVVPSDWNNNDNWIVAIGGGGGGGSFTSGGGGGGGGAYAFSDNLTLTPGAITIGIGAAGAVDTAAGGGDTWFNAASYAACVSVTACVSADGGLGTTNASGVAGGTTGGIGEIEFAGGAGGTGSGADADSSGGGGGAGSSGGTGGSGGAGDANTAGNEGSGGGGGSGCDSIGASNDGVGGGADGGDGGDSCYASGAGTGGTGGGGGATSASGTGGGGADGDTGSADGSAGASGDEYTTVGAGGGGGGGDANSSGTDAVGGGGGLYGGGGGGGETGGAGAQGLLIISYTPTSAIYYGTTTVGRIGQALTFDGSGTYISGGDVDGGGTAKTISFWMKAATTTASQALINVDTSDGRVIETNSGSDVVATGFPAATVYVDGSNASGNIPNRDWHFVTITDSTGVSVDDFAVASTTKIFGGQMDDVRVYDRVLSQDEINRLYLLGGTTKINLTLPTQPALQSGLVGHWTMDGENITSTFPVNDTFTESGNLIASSHSPSSGYFAYTTLGTVGTCNLYVDGTNDRLDGAVSVSSGGCGSSEGQSFQTGLLREADYTVSATVNSSAGDDDVNLFCRIQDSSNLYMVGSANDDVRIYKASGGVWSVIGGQYSISDTNYVLTLSCIGSTISVLKDGATIGSVTDSTITAAGRAGIGFGAIGSKTFGLGVGTQWADDFTVSKSIFLTVKNTVASGADATGNFTLQPGRIGQGAELGGTDGYLTAGNLGSGLKSIAFWMKADDTTSRKIINIDGTDQIELDGSSVVNATSFPGTTVIYVDGAVASTIPDTGWHHVVVTDTTGVNGSTFEMGRVGSSYFDGLLDDVRVYSKVLSQDEVTRLYRLGATSRINTTIDTIPALRSGLVAHWSMDGKNMGTTPGAVVSTGTTSPSTGTQTATEGTISWSLTSNIVTDNGVLSPATLSGTAITQNLRATTYGFAIPPSATIVGIVMAIKRAQTGSIGAARDSYVGFYNMVNGCNSFGDNKALTSTDWPVTTQTYQWYGAPDDAWNMPITPNVVNDSTFGPCLRVTGSIAGTDRIVRVDYIGLNVFYTLPVYTPLDLSGNGNTATAVGAVAAPGRVGQGFKFDGVNDYLNAGSGATIDNIFATGGTIAFWYQANSASGNPVIVKEISSGSSKTGYWIDAGTGSLSFSHAFSSNPFSGTWSTTYGSATTDWKHVALTYDRSSASNDPVIYINGTAASVTEITTPTGAADSDASLDLVFGEYINGADDPHFSGRLDDVRLYNRILSASEVQALYQMGQ